MVMEAVPECGFDISIEDMVFSFLQGLTVFRKCMHPLQGILQRLTSLRLNVI